MPRHPGRGFSLTELLIVVIILGVIAVVVVPGFNSGDEKQLDVTVNEVVQALRFARSESIRTGKDYGVIAESGSQRLRVYWLDTSEASPVAVYSIRHPVDKKLYDLSFETDIYPASLGSVDIRYVGTAAVKDFVGFASNTGTPRYNDSGTIRMLETATIKLSYRDKERTVTVSPMAGRVTVQ